MHQRRAYAFDLPPSQIAQAPHAARDGARLLTVGSGTANLRDGHITELADVITAAAPGAVIVVNDTRVIPARVMAKRPTGGAVELLFVEPEAVPGVVGDTWRCLGRAKKQFQVGDALHVGDTVVRVARARAPGGDATIAVVVDGDALALMAAHGTVPLPPYIERDATADDAERYQTIFAAQPGAVAAPTAGLHLTPALVDALTARGHVMATVTLHVGLGTFMPMRVDDVREHAMHAERFEIPAATAALIASGRPVVAVGTTVVRALEAAALDDARRGVRAGLGVTSIFIYPGGPIAPRVVDHLLTNFHLPESTLLMLVCAFAGTARTLDAYRHAVAAGYRFFSYGDAMFVSRGGA